MCISHHTPLAYPFCAQVSYFIICAFFSVSILKFKKNKKKKPISLKYFILIINCGAHWKLTFIWAIFQYCEPCHYLTAIYSFDSLI